jgi:hypothetical protein
MASTTKLTIEINVAFDEEVVSKRTAISFEDAVAQLDSLKRSYEKEQAKQEN